MNTASRAAAVPAIPAPTTPWGVFAVASMAVFLVSIDTTGSVLGVAATVALVGHAHPQIADFRWLYATHITLSLLTALLCLRVDTRPSIRR